MPSCPAGQDAPEKEELKESLFAVVSSEGNAYNVRITLSKKEQQRRGYVGPCIAHQYGVTEM